MISNIGHGASDYHLITTTHPYLIELGLGSFTLESLYTWWNQKTSDGTYLHRLCINNNRADLGAPANNLQELLGITSDTEFFWDGWEPHPDMPNAGVYKKFDFSAFEGNNGGDSPWTCLSRGVQVNLDDTLLLPRGWPNGPVLGGGIGTYIPGGVSQTTYQPTLAEIPQENKNVFKGLSPIYNLINLNRYMSDFYDFWPRGTWDETATDIGGIDTKKLFASHELLVDIKTAKMGRYIEWSGEVTFFINEGHLCPDGITEWIPFKLHLFDYANSDVSDKTVTLKSMKYVAPKRDVGGRIFGQKVDGEYEDHDPKHISSFGAADIDLSMNPFTKKWESGSPTLLAKMATNLGRATTPDVGSLQTSDIKIALESDEYSYSKFIPASGVAMPIRLQNGNPLQWQPNYLKSKDVRCEEQDYTKETLTVYNFSSQSQFQENETVMLTRIDGVWQVSAIGTKEGESGDVDPSTGKWGEFTYMMTNSDFFFKTATGGTFTPRQAEQYFHSLYYKGDPLNAGAGDSGVDYGLDGGWDKTQPFNTVNVTNVELIHCYAQTTSFDYLDSKLFGVRNKPDLKNKSNSDTCSIATTHALFNAAGVAIPPPSYNITSRNAAHAGVFFGCVFPGGYTGARKYFTPRDWDVVVKSSGTSLSMYKGHDVSDYINTSNSNKSQDLFDAGNRTSDRNNCRQPAQSGPFEELAGGPNKWSRADSRASANLFSDDYTSATERNDNFRSIPADVMTNASPTGKNGSPLYPVHRFVYFHNAQLGLSSSLVQRDAARAFLHCMWLGKTPVSPATLEDPDESAFDFSPNSRDTLMFRPLKMEAYIQFGTKNTEATAKVLTKAGVQDTREGFSSEARRTQMGWERPATLSFEAREKYFELGGKLWSDDWGLKWGGDIISKPGYNNLHKETYWDDSQGPMKWTTKPEFAQGNWEGAGAFGIITTFNTISANSQIGFTTDNIYGMGAAARDPDKFTIERGYPTQERTWGNFSLVDSYKQANIIDLSVRIYHQHPRDQTLYDPRTFAVHHFNPDVRLRGGEFLKDDFTFDPAPHSIQEVIQKGQDVDGKPIKFNYKRKRQRSVVDLRVPSRYKHETDFTVTYNNATHHSDNGLYSSVKLEEDDFILGDATLDSNGDRQTPLIDSTLWDIDDVRVGKLLPFRYESLEIGVPTPEGEEFDVGDNAYSRFSTGLNEVTQDIKHMMIIKNLGAGYAKGDIVGVSSRGVRFKVLTVETIDDPNANPPLIKGQILSLQCISRGTGITISQVAPYGQVFTEGSDGPLKITTLESVDGKDFEAYFVAAKVYKKVRTDPKPYLMKKDGVDVVRVASDKSQGTHLTHGHNVEAENGSFIEEAKETNFILDPTLLSSNRQYDVFFHFHNDISMTWLAGNTDFHGNVHNPSEANEQHITVKINPQ